MRVLIVGSDGQLGREMRRCLADMHSEMGAVDARYADAQVDCADIGDIDIADMTSVDAWFDAHGPYDVVFNCAAVTNVDGCERDEAGALKVNALGPYHLAVAAGRHGSTLVHVSTDYVFAGDVSQPLAESVRPNPISAYGRSKLAGELLAQDANAQTFIVRTAWLYGYRGHNFVKAILAQARSRGSISVVADQWGNPTSANDLAHCLLALALTREFGVYHAAGAQSCSWFDFACTAVETAGISCEKTALTTGEYRRRFPDAAARPRYSLLDSSKLAKTAGVSPRPWPDALRDYLERIDSQGE